MKTPDLVILAPGFFGFDRFGTYSYFADRVSAAIRGHLESAAERPVPVIPVELGPAYSLSYRQDRLLEMIEAVLGTLEGVERIHLVGHSTGGLDAELLLRRHRLPGLSLPSQDATAAKPWSESHVGIRERIASVTTIAAPHFGTTLALTDLARWLAQPVAELSLAGAAAPAVAAFLEAFPEHAVSLSQALGGTRALVSFLVRFFKRRELLTDLRPERVESIRANNPRVIQARVSCFVTCPLPNPDPVVSEFETPDSLFLYLTNHTAGVRVPSLSDDVVRNIERLNAPNVVRIASESRVPRPRHVIDGTDNDAVVNSARQLSPGDELAAIVYADHADVLGHYDRRDPTFRNQVINEGVFRSGARFGDDEFFALYRAVAARICTAMSPSDYDRRRPEASRASGDGNRSTVENVS